ncbi:MAG: type 2 isopentenyl-diphosphate Delta-isomerase [Candidatus Paceibacterota bacterium]|jgi:isopentenyl-diphosphate delta-isomerase
MSITKRKEDHIEICLKEGSGFCKKSGFEKYELLHNAIADFNFEDIDISSDFLGKKIDHPIIISSITGGCERARKINTNLAIAADRLNIAMSCGSQKAMIKDKKQACTYEIRSVAPGILYMGNIGLDYLKNYENFAKIRSAIKSINADGVFVHLNLAQELVQAEGERNFADSTQNLTNFVKFMDLPVITKEVGFGISGKTAKILERTGVRAIDVAGAGGTSWTRVESFRQADSGLANRFSEWGIPTAESLVQCRKAVKMPIIASGGIYDGITACKAFALGADLVGLAGPLLKAANISPEKVIEYLDNFILELKTAMMLVGARNLNELKNNKEIIYKVV